MHSLIQFMCSFSYKLGQIKFDYKEKIVQMSFIIMYNYATVIDILQPECHFIILQVLV